MQFKPLTDKEIAELGLWPEGEYVFEVLEYTMLGGKEFKTEDRLSKNNHQMIQLVLNVYNSEGKFITLLDFLLEAMAFKFKHACQTTGMEDKYNSGQILAHNFIGKHGNLREVIRNGEKDGQYPHPEFVEWMMGFPIGHTDLKHLETP